MRRNWLEGGAAMVVKRVFSAAMAAVTDSDYPAALLVFRIISRPLQGCQRGKTV